MASAEQQAIEFSIKNGRRVRGNFDGGDISSNGGLMLVREADRRLKLTSPITKAVEDKRQSGKVRHEAIPMIRQRVYGMCTGDEDLNDFGELRRDPLWQTACEVDRPFAGKSTLCRFENKADRKLAEDKNHFPTRYPHKQASMDCQQRLRPT